MSKVATCPTCGSKAKISEINGEILYHSLQEDDLIKKIAQLKKAMLKFKEKAAVLEEKLNQITNK